MTVTESRKALTRSSGRVALGAVSQTGELPREASPPKPWEAQFTDVADIEKVRRTAGPHFNRSIYWIPGVVLIAVSKPGEFEDSLNELRAALGRDGLTTGILLMFPGTGRIPTLSREMLAHGRIRVQAADSTLLKQPHIDEEVLVEKIVRSTLSRLSSASATWLKTRAEKLAQTSRARHAT